MANAVHHGTGRRICDLPIRPEMLIAPAAEAKRMTGYRHHDLGPASRLTCMRGRLP
jgi:hypothetical protein